MNPPLDGLARLRELQREYEEMKASLPAHSISPTMMIRLEELEDEIAQLQRKLASECDT